MKNIINEKSSLNAAFFIKKLYIIYMDIFMNLLKKKKIIYCKYCKKSLRIPYLKGKTLKVYCPHCGNRFEVIIQDTNFINSIKAIFHR